MFPTFQQLAAAMVTTFPDLGRTQSRDRMRSRLNWPDVRVVENVTEHQRAKLAIATSANVALLSGGPGTGKTHVLAALIHAIQKQQDIVDYLSGDQKHRPDAMAVAVAAPTGKAAVRITEAMHANGLKLHATTIHTLLQIDRQGYDGDGWTFAYNEHNPLPIDFLAIDEPSMLDADMAAHLLSACDPGTKILFTGDPFQLPPVQHGRPFADMIAAGLPHGHLTEIHRFSGRIADVCKDIREGKRWEPSAKIDLLEDYPENFRHFERSTAGGQIECLRELVRRLTGDPVCMGGKSVDPIDGMQVICAHNESGPVSVKAINPIMQEMLNPHGLGLPGVKFRVHDKVMNLNNHWYPVWGAIDKKRINVKEKSELKVYVANGDIGRVLEVAQDYLLIQFTTRLVKVVKSFWMDIQLAYAVTGHKSQGSQWPAVITLIDETARICSREWYTTALSRQSKVGFLVGRRDIADRHCRTPSLDKRNTFLAQDIKLWLPGKMQTLV